MLLPPRTCTYGMLRCGGGGTTLRVGAWQHYNSERFKQDNHFDLEYMVAPPEDLLLAWQE